MIGGESNERSSTAVGGSAGFESIVEQVGVPLLVVRAFDESVIYANPAADDAFALAPGALVGRDLGDLLFDAAPLRAVVSELARSGQVEPVEVALRRADGTFSPMEAALDPLFFRGEPVFVTTFRDLRELRRVEGDLRVTAQVERLLSSVSTRLLALGFEEVEGGLELALQEIGEATLADSGFLVLLDDADHPERVLRWLSELHEDGPPPIWEGLLGESLGGILAEVESERIVEMSSLDATRRAALPFSLLVVPIVGQGRPRGLLGLASLNPAKRWDRTREPLRTVAQICANVLQRRDAELRFAVEQRRAEEERQKANKLEAVGILAGGIAHDFRNILLVIQGNTSLARRTLELSEQVEPSALLAFLEDVEAASVRARDLTEQLLTFSKGGKPVKKAISLLDILRQSVQFALRGSKVVCESSLAKDLWPVEADAGQINQVLNNLLINAGQAMPEGGEVRLTAENISRRVARERFDFDADVVRIQVIDEGVGIAPEDLSRIFDPYFTTKETGSGLGLATVHSIVRKHGGTMRVTSELGVGSTFSIHLPACRRARIDTATEEAASAHGEGRILVVDDEPAVRKLILGMLKALGYRAEAVADGAAALDFYAAAAAADPFDVVLCDLTIPGGMGGREAVARLREIDPAVRCVVTSGYSKDPIMANYREHGFAEVLMKPFVVDELGRLLARVLG